ncbi:MAG: hypothetical protein HGB00_02910 [Chlorobiaceae bacterium]|nr:hypothetical protein [Chlorobiaceae bacterium]
MLVITESAGYSHINHADGNVRLFINACPGYWDGSIGIKATILSAAGVQGGTLR